MNDEFKTGIAYVIKTKDGDVVAEGKIGTDEENQSEISDICSLHGIPERIAKLLVFPEDTRFEDACHPAPFRIIEGTAGKSREEDKMDYIYVITISCKKTTDGKELWDYEINDSKGALIGCGYEYVSSSQALANAFLDKIDHEAGVK